MSDKNSILTLAKITTLIAKGDRLELSEIDGSRGSKVKEAFFFGQPNDIPPSDGPCLCQDITVKRKNSYHNSVRSCDWSLASFSNYVAQLEDSDILSELPEPETGLTNGLDMIIKMINEPIGTRFLFNSYVWVISEDEDGVRLITSDVDPISTTWTYNMCVAKPTDEQS